MKAKFIVIFLFLAEFFLLTNCKTTRLVDMYDFSGIERAEFVRVCTLDTTTNVNSIKHINPDEYKYISIDPAEFLKLVGRSKSAVLKFISTKQVILYGKGGEEYRFHFSEGCGGFKIMGDRNASFVVPKKRVEEVKRMLTAE